MTVTYFNINGTSTSNGCVKVDNSTNNGRMRFDETECSSGSSKNQIALWIKTHKDEDYKPTVISMDGWCK